MALVFLNTLILWRCMVLLNARPINFHFLLTIVNKKLATTSVDISEKNGRSTFFKFCFFWLVNTVNFVKEKLLNASKCENSTIFQILITRFFTDFFINCRLTARMFLIVTFLLQAARQPKFKPNDSTFLLSSRLEKKKL